MPRGESERDGLGQRQKLGSEVAPKSRERRAESIMRCAFTRRGPMVAMVAGARGEPVPCSKVSMPMTLEASAEDLLRTALFAELSASEALVLAGLLRPFAADAGEVLAVQGAPADRLFLVDEGRLDAFVSEPDGSSELLSTVGPGDHLGEMALNHAMLRLATIRAREPTRGRVLLAEDFAALRRACEPLALKVLLRLARLLCARLRKRTSAITGSNAGSSTGTIADASPEASDQAGPSRLPSKALPVDL